jgi:flavin reductase (DIM6/NTAB) family NADH-FMN oxidoreductase RutF
MAGSHTAAGTPAGDMALEPAAFRALFGSYPTAVSVVTTLDARGEPVGLTCSAVCSLSSRPPLLLVCVDERSNTLGPLLSHGAFVVNILAGDAAHVARLFAGKSQDKFADVRWVPSEQAKGAPLLTDAALGHAECLITASHAAGDHWILIGAITKVTSYPRRALLYHQGGYHTWETAVDPRASPGGTAGAGLGETDAQSGS